MRRDDDDGGTAAVVRRVLARCLSQENVASWERFLEACGAAHVAMDEASGMFSLQEKTMHEEFEALFESQVADACREVGSLCTPTSLQGFLAKLHLQGDAMVDTFASVVSLATSMERFAEVVRSPSKREYLFFILRQYARQFEQSVDAEKRK